MLSLNIPSKLRGYAYLREAIPRMMKDPDQPITKVLYPAVGAVFGCKGTHVERSIRSAIDTAWKQRDDRVWQRYFRVGSDGVIPRPSNADLRLIGAVSEIGKRYETAQYRGTEGHKCTTAADDLFRGS